MSDAVILRGRLARRVREEAKKAGLSLEEYVVELLSQGLGPRERALVYVEAAEELLGEALEELRRGNVRQAAEKLWGAAALAVKAHAYFREGKRLASHRELWAYKRVLEDELGEWVHDSWASAAEMHICFHEGWCSERDVEEAHKRIERLVKDVTSSIKGRQKS